MNKENVAYVRGSAVFIHTKKKTMFVVAILMELEILLSESPADSQRQRTSHFVYMRTRGWNGCASRGREKRKGGGDRKCLRRDECAQMTSHACMKWCNTALDKDTLKST